MTTGTYIGGEYRDGTGATTTLVDPATGEGFREIVQSGASDVSDAVDAARAAAPAWAAQTPGQRRLPAGPLADAALSPDRGGLFTPRSPRPADHFTCTP